MKRSGTVKLVLVAAISATMNDCAQTPRRCVDQNNLVTDPANCQNTSGGPSSGRFHWYYGGNSGSAGAGAQVSGGSATQPGNTVWGVFGGEGAAHGGGGDAAGAGAAGAGE